MKTYFFISAMFRSGSTMVARMLNIHDHVACASDPMRPLFNSFRYDMAEHKYRLRHNRFDPLDDYFLQDCDLLKRILNGSFNVDTTIDNNELMEQVKNRAKDFSGDWANALENMNFRTYDQYINYFLKKIGDVYGKDKSTSCVAFKEVWSTEFYPALKRIIPSLKCIILVRDPRAVVASKNATGVPYPYFFMGRQWRKLACLGAFMKHFYKKDVYLMRYEDLVSYPEKYVKELCDFLGIDFDMKLLDVTQYKDGSDNPWLQNTNYDVSSPQSINSDSVDRWKSQLDEHDTRSLELLCYDWMKEYNYFTSHEKASLLSIEPDEFKVVEEKELAKWIRPFAFEQDEDWLANQMIIEKMRLGNMNNEFTPIEQLRLQFKWW